MIRAAIFDFDGVILESAEIKTRAFAALFDGDERAVAYHVEHAGISRYEKFRHICTEILGEPYDEQREAELGERFSALVFEEVLRCPFVPGARELLERRSAQARLFVASGTPQEELREIVSARGLEPFFAGVYGSPDTKDLIAARILDAERIAPHDALFVGDAMTDLLGARAAGIPFVGRVADGDEDPFATERVHTVPSLLELDAQWDDLDAAPPPVP